MEALYCYCAKVTKFTIVSRVERSGHHDYDTNNFAVASLRIEVSQVRQRPMFETSRRM